MGVIYLTRASMTTSTQRELKHWNVPELKAAVEALDNGLWANVHWANQAGEWRARKSKPQYLKVTVSAPRRVVLTISQLPRCIDAKVVCEITSEGTAPFILARPKVTISALFHA